MDNIIAGGFIALMLTVSTAATAKSELEIGAGVFSVQLPHYPGANQRKTYVVPTPYIYYSSDKLKIDRNQLTGYLWRNGNWHLDLSLGAGISVNSDDNRAREGMPDIDWVLELGPSLKYYIAGTPQSKNRWYTEFFARKAIATDFKGLDDAGWRYGPSMSYRRQIYNQGKHNVEFSLRGSANFSDSKYLDYYYGVASEHETANRVAYRAKTGYAGSDLSIGLTYKSPKYWVGGFVRYYGLQGAIQRNSPLFFKQNDWSAGLGFVWIFYNKKRS